MSKYSKGKEVKNAHQALLAALIYLKATGELQIMRGQPAVTGPSKDEKTGGLVYLAKVNLGGYNPRTILLKVSQEDGSVTT